MTSDELRGKLDDAQDRAAAAGERVAEAKSAAGERMTEREDRRRRADGRARTAAGERVADAKAAAERVADAKAATADAIAKVKPRLRGVSHEWAFFVALVAGAILVALAAERQGDARRGDLRRLARRPARRRARYITG